jgi:hypothetical protein
MAARPVERQETVGPSWASVQEVVVSIENHHKVYVTCETRFSHTRGAGQHTYWTLSACVAAPIEDRVHLRSVCRGWPHPDHKTVPGLLTGMLYELDEALAKLRWHQGKLSL